MLSFTLSGKHMTYAYTHLKHITITDIRIFMHSYNELIQLHYAYNRLMLIRISHRTHTCTYSNFMLVQISRRSYRTYSYSKVPVGITDQNNIHLFTLIRHLGFYYITMGIPRPVIRNE